ncbi:MAG: thiamine pyrophosphate-binding protein [Armatimonadetes bacterium]|nr:thiamine pyrophosphate-binding protein [Armatimonadota bacterium]
MRVARYLFQRLKEHGVEVTFGIPGDFALPLFAAQEASGMRTVVMTHEPSVGYAADVYARLRGLGVAIVTYGAGALNMVNAVAMAYAEESPMLVLSGAPEVRSRRPEVLFHHRVKSYESQHRVYQEVTEASAVLQDPRTAAYEIDRVLDTVRTRSRPGYLEIPRDMVNAALDPHGPVFERPEPDKSGLDEALAEIADRLRCSRSAVVFAGQEVERFGLMDRLTQLAEKLNLPVATSLIGKSVIPEHHPCFIGNYMGRVSDNQVRQVMEEADCILALGIFFSDMDTGGFSAQIQPARVIQATSSHVRVSHHVYPNLTLTDVLEGLLARADLPRREALPRVHPDPRPAAGGPQLTMDGIFEELNAFLQPHHLVIADVGDPLFGAVELRASVFIGAGYYGSMGLAVPGAIGAQLADPAHRPVVLVGDGAFKMDGVEIATAVDLGLNPIVVVVNNGTFATLRVLDRDRDYLKVRPWDYVGLARALGATGERVSTRAAFACALRRAETAPGVYLIDAVTGEQDASLTLRRMADQFGPRIRQMIEA